jgi:hypothetical protein
LLLLLYGIYPPVWKPVNDMPRARALADAGTCRATMLLIDGSATPSPRPWRRQRQQQQQQQWQWQGHQGCDWKKPEHADCNSWQQKLATVAAAAPVAPAGTAAAAPAALLPLALLCSRHLHYSYAPLHPFPASC